MRPWTNTIKLTISFQKIKKSLQFQSSAQVKQSFCNIKAKIKKSISNQKKLNHVL